MFETWMKPGRGGAFNSFAVRFNTSSRREAIQTRAPPCDSASANARPMPVPPPVTSATCSDSGLVLSGIVFTGSRAR